MEAEKFLTNKKSKSFVEEFLTNGFEEFSFENTMMKVVNVDIHTLVEGDLTTLIITYRDTVVNYGKLEEKYFTSHISLAAERQRGISSRSVQERMQIITDTTTSRCGRRYYNCLMKIYNSWSTKNLKINTRAKRSWSLVVEPQQEL